MTKADLGTKSIPRNPLLFGVLHRMDAVEKIGSGIRRIQSQCMDHGLAEPRFDVSQHWVTTTFWRPDIQGVRRHDPVPGTEPEAQDAHPKQAPEAQDGLDSAPDGLKGWQIAMLAAAAAGPATGRDLLAASGYASRTGSFKRTVRKYLAARVMELTLPDKPTSRYQRYRLTDRGRRLLESAECWQPTQAPEQKDSAPPATS